MIEINRLGISCNLLKHHYHVPSRLGTTCSRAAVFQLRLDRMTKGKQGVSFSTFTSKDSWPCQSVKLLFPQLTTPLQTLLGSRYATILRSSSSRWQNQPRYPRCVWPKLPPYFNPKPSIRSMPMWASQHRANPATESLRRANAAQSSSMGGVSV